MSVLVNIPNTTPRTAPVRALLERDTCPETAGRLHIPHMVPHTAPHTALPLACSMASHKTAGRIARIGPGCMISVTIILKSTAPTVPQNAPMSTDRSRDGRASVGEGDMERRGRAVRPGYPGVCCGAEVTAGGVVPKARRKLHMEE